MKSLNSAITESHKLSSVAYAGQGYIDEDAIERRQQRMKEILEAMKATNAIFSEAIAKGNVAALESVYTADARVLPPGAEMVSGRLAIQQFWAGAIKGLGLRRAVLETIDAMPAGDGVVEIGGGELETASGRSSVKYVVFWRQEQGCWKWHVDIWNPNS
jgi:ketosteroid isomerase-like protein